MGLSVVHGLVRNHEGAIDVQSTPGQGTVCEVLLPIVESAATHRNGHVGPTPRGSEHLMFVDDERSLSDMAREMLKRLGYTVSVATNGKEATAIYERQWRDIDLVILDMVMAEMDGRETFRAMRKINPNVVALLSSGYSLNGEAQSILDEGVRGFIQKPVRTSELSTIVAEALKTKKTDGQ